MILVVDPGVERLLVAWDANVSVLPELKTRVDEAIQRYERIRVMAPTGS